MKGVKTKLANLAPQPRKGVVKKRTQDDDSADELDESLEIGFGAKEKALPKTFQAATGAQQHMQAAAQQVVTSLPISKMIPEELRNFTKSDVTFFLEKIPLALKNELCYRNFLKLLNLYVEGVITQFELNELVQDMKCSTESDDVLIQMQTILSLRNSSRRFNNNLLKPLSEIDLAQFSEADHITPNYYRLSDCYPMPVCSGRFLNPICKSVLNDRYCSVNLVQSKFKHKNVHEDLLFKNEDDMYSSDYVIL